MSEQITYTDFEKVDIRVGTIIESRSVSRGAQTGLQDQDRFRRGDRRQEIIGADHGALYAGKAGGTAGSGRRQLSTAPDRTISLGSADTRFRRQGWSHRSRQCGTCRSQWREDVLNIQAKA